MQVTYTKKTDKIKPSFGDKGSVINYDSPFFVGVRLDLLPLPFCSSPLPVINDRSLDIVCVSESDNKCCKGTFSMHYDVILLNVSHIINLGGNMV